MLTQVLSGGKVGQVVGCIADDEGNVYLANLASAIGGSFPNLRRETVRRLDRQGEP
jgi:hypothetical protein